MEADSCLSKGDKTISPPSTTFSSFSPHLVIMSDNPMQGADTRGSCNMLPGRSLDRTCVFQRFTKWLWSSWVAVPSEPQSTVQNNPRHGKDHNYSLASGTPDGSGTAGNNTPRYIPSEPPQEQIAEYEKYPCKACQAWGVTCDRQRPRCAHCLDQQILCFYVAPLPKTIRRPKQSASSHPTRQRASVGVSG